MKLKGVWRDLLKFLFAKLREEIYFRLSLILCIDPVSNKLRSSLLKLLKAFISKLLREFHFFFAFFYTRRLLQVFVCHPQICKSGYEKSTDKYFELLIFLCIWANKRFLSDHMENMSVVIKALIILNQVQCDMMCKVLAGKQQCC